MTDMMGNFAINVPPGTYMLYSDAPTFINSSAMVVVGESEIVSADIHMDLDDVTGESEVSVHDENTYDDLPGAFVTINPGNITGVSGDDGDFYINLDPGTYTINVTRNGYQDYTTTTEVVAGQVMTVEAIMTPKAAAATNSSDSGKSGLCFVESLPTPSTGQENRRALLALAGMLLAVAAVTVVRQRS